MRSLLILASAALVVGAAPAKKPLTPNDIVAGSPASAWRTIDPGDLLVMDLASGGRVVRRFGWPRRILAIVVVLSFALAAFAWVRVLSSVVGAVTESPQATPGLTERTFSPGRYGVFERTGTSTGAGGITFTENQLPRLRPGDVTITGPTGAVVPTRFMDANESINQSGHLYTGVVEFDITEGPKGLQAANVRKQA